MNICTEIHDAKAIRAVYIQLVRDRLNSDLTTNASEAYAMTPTIVFIAFDLFNPKRLHGRTVLVVSASTLSLTMASLCLLASSGEASRTLSRLSLTPAEADEMRWPYSNSSDARRRNITLATVAPSRTKRSSKRNTKERILFYQRVRNGIWGK